MATISVKTMGCLDHDQCCLALFFKKLTLHYIVIQVCNTSNLLDLSFYRMQFRGWNSWKFRRYSRVNKLIENQMRPAVRNHFRTHIITLQRSTQSNPSLSRFFLSDGSCESIGNTTWCKKEALFFSLVVHSRTSTYSSVPPVRVSPRRSRAARGTDRC